ncbi:Patched domain-containing protein 3 [Symbiodinium microadriaticum]|uniref:Patched domain-containing protein 3 n=1 Tax=Symbiodinium microadriaticum TaxID=2951 RepID=A0A1Q9C4I4_SYMMI|nr:Patched domain-containing protein 3 [Symbiodinium microadriaticum]CAE7793999.1 Ptchd3 [Symbiodinium sp. KB8]
MATQPAPGHPSRGLRLERRLSASSDLVGHAQESFFRCLARWITRYPVLAIAVSLTAYLACVPGMLLLPGSESMFGILRIKTGFLDTFTFKTTDEYRDYKRGTDVFPDTRSLVFIAKPLNGRRLVSSDVMRQIHKAEVQIEEVTRFESVQGHQLGFRDVCERFNSGSPCMVSSATATLLGKDVAARLSELEALELDGSTPAHVAAALLVAGMSVQQRSSLPLLIASSRPFPGPDASEASLSEWLLEGTAAMSTFTLLDTDDGVGFEKQVAKDINQNGYPENAIVRINQFSSSTIATESLLIGMDNVPLIGITISIMAGYLVVMLGTDTRIPGNSQVKVLLGGTCIPGLSGLASFGLLGYLGHGVSVLGTMVPFLGLAVGVDVIFLMVSSVNAVGPDVKNMEEVMVKALPRGGRAATTTTLTSVCAFSIAAATSADLPSFFWFNIGLVLVLIMNWIGMVIMFPAMITLSQRNMTVREEPKSGFAAKARLAMGGGRRLRGIMTAKLGYAVQRSLSFQIFGASAWIALTLLGICFGLQVERGMPDTDLVTDSSRVNAYFEDVESSFVGSLPIELGLVLDSPRTLDASYRSRLSELIAALNNRSDLVLPVDCWLQRAVGSLSSSASMCEVDTAILMYLNQSDVSGRDARGGVTEHLRAARCRAFLWQPTDAKKRSEQASDIISQVKEGFPELEVIPYHLSFPTQTARYRIIKDKTFSTAGFAFVGVFLAVLITMPVHLAMLALANIMAVTSVLFGFMWVCGITSNLISFTVCVMTIGFCVDYSCHVVHFADHGVSPGTPWDQRMRLSLESCSFDVLQGCLTAFLGVAMLGFGSAQAFRIFALLSVIITLVGGFFALIGLPCLLALLSRAWHACAGQAEEFLSDAVLPVPKGTEAKLVETRNLLLSVDRVSL